MRIQIDIPATLIDDLDGIAEDEGASRTQIVQTILEEHLYDGEPPEGE